MQDGTTIALKGSLNEVCLAGLDGLFNMFADCAVECSCCAACCKPDEEGCNDWVTTFRLSDTQDRSQFLFSEDKIFDADTTPSE
jgi:hypothetical protein